MALLHGLLHAQGIYNLLQQLPPPFGTTAPSSYRPLSCFLTTKSNNIGSQEDDIPEGAVIVDWSNVPPALDPCSLLDNAINTANKKGVGLNKTCALNTSLHSTFFFPAP